MLQEYLQIHDPSPSFYCVVNVDYEALCSDFVWKLAHSKYNRWTEKGTHAEPRETGRKRKEGEEWHFFKKDGQSCSFCL